MFMPLSIFAQSAHSRLKDPALLKRFDSLSHKIMCTCGCNMPLRNCNHTGHCNAWPAREVLDKLLLEGKSDAAIISGFRSGFGSLVDTDEAFAMARSNDYSYMVAQFKNGFGAQIMSIPESNYLAVFVMFGIVLCAGIVMLFIRRRKNAKAETPLALLDEGRRAEILSRITKDES
jgi:cytochrome c-type biogenesis protein CcmH/NrfF